MPAPSNAGAMAMPSGPPYPPTVWGLGGTPNPSVDVPVTAVFLALFILGAIGHMTIFQLNRRRGHKFLMSGLLFGFCMARIVTCIMRIASLKLPTNFRIAIAAQVFVSAGVVILYIVNLIFAQRIMRASHPNFGWHMALSTAFKALYVLIVITIAMVIVVGVQSFYTLNANIHRIDRDVQLYGLTFFAVVAFIPLPLVIGGLVVPRSRKLDKFGHGRWRTKIRILLLATLLVAFGAAYRAGTSWKNPVPRTLPMPAYFHKGAFYMVNFGVEIIVVLMYAILRVDRRFHIPDGARGPGSYSEKPVAPESSVASPEPPRAGLPLVFSEEETFDEDEFAEAQRQEKDIEKGRPNGHSDSNAEGSQLSSEPVHAITR